VLVQRQRLQRSTTECRLQWANAMAPTLRCGLCGAQMASVICTSAFATVLAAMQVVCMKSPTAVPVPHPYKPWHMPWIAAVQPAAMDA